jgi:hypothetical protein
MGKRGVQGVTTSGTPKIITYNIPPGVIMEYASITYTGTSSITSGYAMLYINDKDDGTDQEKFAVYLGEGKISLYVDPSGNYTHAKAITWHGRIDMKRYKDPMYLHGLIIQDTGASATGVLNHKWRERNDV